MDNIHWIVEWENKNNPEKHSKKFFREAGYGYTDATVYADAVFDFNPSLVQLSITVYDGDTILCRQSVIG